ncbi:MAG: DNA polymerase III subunit gamma/tau [candidate division WOR-3 bacterium]
MNLPLKYRPKRFSDVVNQEHVVRTLQNALRLGPERLGQAYLFTGPRGIGKTTIARLLAMALNCERGPADEPCGECQSCRAIIQGNPMDVIEIDGASNRGIDEIRNIKEQIRFPPAYSRFKIYIIDEVHMLTTEAFNALLKTLEEPPDYLVFMFATTDPQRIPRTVLSRVQRFDLRPITAGDIAARLETVASLEGISVEPEAMKALSEHSDGSLRDALVMLEQLWVYSGGSITKKDVLNLLGVVEKDFYRQLFVHIKERDASGALRHLDSLLARGYTPADFTSGLVNFLAEMLRAKMGVSDDEDTRRLAQAFPREDLLAYAGISFDLESSLRYRINPRAWAEHAVLRMALLPSAVDIERALRGGSEIRAEEIPRGPSAPIRKKKAQDEAKPQVQDEALKKLIETFKLEEIEDELWTDEGRDGS